MHHQSIDITPAEYNRDTQTPEDPVAQAQESLDKRTEITKGARDQRRKQIREANFLRGL